MTRKQLNAITRIQQHKLDDQHEVKRFRVIQIGRTAMVFITVGTKGDEGTLASVFFRETGMFSVGTRGGIKALSAKKGTKEKASKYPLIWGWSS